MKDANKWVTATEIASWGYCPEAWRLDQGLGLEPENKAELKQGIVRHERWEKVEKRSSKLLELALWLLIVVVLGWIGVSVIGGRW